MYSIRWPAERPRARAGGTPPYGGRGIVQQASQRPAPKDDRAQLHPGRSELQNRIESRSSEQTRTASASEKPPRSSLRQFRLVRRSSIAAAHSSSSLGSEAIDADNRRKLYYGQSEFFVNDWCENHPSAREFHSPSSTAADAKPNEPFSMPPVAPMHRSAIPAAASASARRCRRPRSLSGAENLSAPTTIEIRVAVAARICEVMSD